MHKLLILLILFKALLKLAKDVLIDPLIAYDLELNSPVFPQSSIEDLEVVELRTCVSSLCCNTSAEGGPFLA